jgi:WD40 repeat protein
VAVWDLRTGERLRQLTGHRAAVNAVAVSPYDHHVVSGSDDQTVAVWDLRTGERLRQLTEHRAAVNAVAVSPYGRHVVSGSDDKTVAVWDLRTGERLRQLTGHRAAVNAVAVSPYGHHVVSGSFDKTVAVWDLETGQRLTTLTLDDGVISLTWHVEGRLFVAGDKGGNLYCFEYREPRVVGPSSGSGWLDRTVGRSWSGLLLRIRRVIRSKT